CGEDVFGAQNRRAFGGDEGGTALPGGAASPRSGATYESSGSSPTFRQSLWVILCGAWTARRTAPLPNLFSMASRVLPRAAPRAGVSSAGVPTAAEPATDAVGRAANSSSCPGGALCAALRRCVVGPALAAAGCRLDRVMPK